MKQLTEQDLDARLAEVKKELMAKIGKPKFEVGKVYKLPETDSSFDCLWMVTAINDKDLLGYGFIGGDWEDPDNEHGIRFRDGVEATPQEWESALIKEAERRGFVIGKEVTAKFGSNGNIKTIFLTDFFGRIAHLNPQDKNGYVLGTDIYGVMVDGIWAEVIKDKPLDESKLITDTKALIKEAIGCAEATALVQFVTVGGKEYQLTVNLKLV